MNNSKSRQNNNHLDKGFTLVELIVVIVILAILAAILTPALLGYIDKAKQSSAILDAEYVTRAVQVKAAEAYARGDLKIIGENGAIVTNGSNYPRLSEMTDLLDDRGFGNPGNDYGWKKKQVVVNGFGNNQSGIKGYKGNKHFVCQVSDRGQILNLTYCDGTTMVTYSPEKGYVCEKTICKKGDKQNPTYNYICVGNASTEDYNTIVKKYFFTENSWK